MQDEADSDIEGSDGRMGREIGIAGVEQCLGRVVGLVSIIVWGSISLVVVRTIVCDTRRTNEWNGVGSKACASPQSDTSK